MIQKYQQSWLVFLSWKVVTFNDTNLQKLDRRRCHRASPAVQNTDRSCTSYHCTLSQTNLWVQTRTETQPDSTVNTSKWKRYFRFHWFAFLEQGLGLFKTPISRVFTNTSKLDIPRFCAACYIVQRRKNCYFEHELQFLPWRILHKRRQHKLTDVTLCVSADMLVTPGTVKSNGSSENPAFFIKGTRNPPRQLSTCTGMLYRFPNCKWIIITCSNTNVSHHDNTKYQPWT